MEGITMEQEIMLDWKQRLRIETNELIVKVNKLQDFFRTETFYKLDRVRKDLMYAQLKSMLDYIQILGKRCELEGIELNKEE